eukprot:2256893-Pleurochrysis_carterae.AAC.1
MAAYGVGPHLVYSRLQSEDCPIRRCGPMSKFVPYKELDRACFSPDRRRGSEEDAGPETELEYWCA